MRRDPFLRSTPGRERRQGKDKGVGEGQAYGSCDELLKSVLECSAAALGLLLLPGILARDLDGLLPCLGGCGATGRRTPGFPVSCIPVILQGIVRSRASGREGGESGRAMRTRRSQVTQTPRAKQDYTILHLDDKYSPNSAERQLLPVREWYRRRRT